ncbi:hypothetical protein [Clostridium formicaceticum]|uniref:Uncharacterized protein n=1 Tax=Clostridium formicaceticum TaxID=1497 RepID=A0AAC9RJY3_9CLOT|nr:hypothetical protein [Clostridium formicaceticum]AOY76976.1 hypothetical protein BJL90_14595 [Clostridium formicaceticum]ARE87461.1 hypothetical protein CLFO_18610 [Clostridium formicaceticum]
MDSLNLQQDPYFPDFQPVCIIADKVYAHCQQRECFEKVGVPLPDGEPFEFVDITFNAGEIIEGTLMVTPIKNRPNFSRVRFKVGITFTLRVKSTETGMVVCIPGALPPIQKDIVLFIPEARDEFVFKIVIETASHLLTEPMQENQNFVFAVGIFIIIKVVGKVQLLIPEFGFCPEPPECEEFAPDDICEVFEMEPFPPFFPKQLEDMNEEEFF